MGKVCLPPCLNLLWSIPDKIVKVLILIAPQPVFKSFLKEIEITAEDISDIVENTFYREITIFYGSGRITIPTGMPNIMNFIETVKQLNPAITVKLRKLARFLK